MDITRRDFLRTLGKTTIAVGSLPLILESLGLGAAHAAGLYPEAVYYQKLTEKRVQCDLCPMEHVLADGQRGPCLIRENHGGTLLTHAWENPAIVKIDPIEKLPTTHFLPDTKTLTIATGGCNLKCLYCQNWQQSQRRPEDLRTIDLPAVQAVKRALGREIPTIAFSYTEPFMFYEYALDIARRAKAKGMRVVLATGGYIKKAPLLELCRHVDAITVGLKAFTEKAYSTLTSRSLAHVLETIVTIQKETKVWLELTNLVVPTYNDDRKTVTAMCRWIASELGRDVPIHFGRFVPKYKLKNLPQTPLRSLEEAREIALKEGLRFAYVSNVAPHEGNNTYCPDCGKPLIRRVGFKVLATDVKDGRCRHCHREIPGVWK